MKKILTTLFTLVIVSAVVSQNTINFQAEITNRNGDTIYIKDASNKTIKELVANKKGIFKGTFDVKTGFYSLYDGVEYAQLFLKGGFDLKLKLNAKEFDETLSYSGKGAEENNFIAKQSISFETFETEHADKSKDDFYAVFDAKKKADFEKLEASNFDPEFTSKFKKDMMQMFLGMQMSYKASQAKKGLTGKQSVNFVYENHAGGTTSLESLRGKFVYVDVWATWCGPCRAEIPSLKKIEERYHSKKIEFVSISIDDKKDYEKWRKFVTDKQLGGVQLYADGTSEFIKYFAVNSIPRFILIDPDGNVLDSDAKRPSDDKLQVQLDGLLK